MKASRFYRIAAVLLLLFAAGHTLGFRQSDPKWGVDARLGSMRSIHFDVPYIPHIATAFPRNNGSIRIGWYRRLTARP